MIQEASSPTSGSQQVHLPRRSGQVTQGFVPSGLENLQGWKLHHLCLQPLDCPVRTSLSMLSIQLDAANVLWSSRDTSLDLGSDTSDVNPAPELSAG